MSGSTNFCNCATPMSTCAAIEPKKCKYFLPSSSNSQICMFRSIYFGDGEYHCDCIAAQSENRKEQSKEKIDEAIDGEIQT